MKNLLILGLLFLMSCNDCTITEIEEPERFDCPELMLNIGDGCNDGNPDTNNDTVDANCVCIGVPVTACAANLLALRAEVETGGLGSIFLDRAEQAPIGDLLFTSLLPVVDNTIQTGEAFPVQFSTVRSDPQQYLFGFQYDQASSSRPLFQTNTNGTPAPAFSSSETPYAAPVYLQGVLYAIDVISDATTTEYLILSIDPSNNQPTVLLSGSVTTNSEVFNPLFFSANNGNNKVFFLAGTSLFEYNTDDNSFIHTLLLTEQDQDMPVKYTGIEYRTGGSQLLALKHQSIGVDIISTLVSISDDGAFTQSDIVPVNGFFLFQDAGVLHSTAYAECDDKYYISAPTSAQGVSESDLVEINVATGTLNSQTFPDFLFGLEIEPNL